MLLAAPHGQPLGRGDRRIVIAGYLLVTVGTLPLALFWDPRSDCEGCPTNPFLFEDNETFFEIWNTLLSLVGLVLIALVLRSLVVRWRRATRPERRLYAPMYAAGVALMIAVLAQLSVQTSGSQGRALDILFIVSVIPLALVPYLFVAAFVRTRMAQSGAVSELMTHLAEAPAARPVARRPLRGTRRPDARARLLAARGPALRRLPGTELRAAGGRPRARDPLGRVATSSASRRSSTTPRSARRTRTSAPWARQPRWRC